MKEEARERKKADGRCKLKIAITGERRYVSNVLLLSGRHRTATLMQLLAASTEPFTEREDSLRSITEEDSLRSITEREDALRSICKQCRLQSLKPRSRADEGLGLRFFLLFYDNRCSLSTSTVSDHGSCAHSASEELKMTRTDELLFAVCALRNGHLSSFAPLILA
jgi:hypothetical protein